MLFSREDVANTINRLFEPAWEMVRPVPIIRIDFGDGNVATRTLHGNIASHVCTTDGQVVDILPGIYTPSVYQAALEQIQGVAGALGPVAADRRAHLREYHLGKARMLRANPDRIVYPRAVSAVGPAAAVARFAAVAPPRAPAPALPPAELNVGKRAVEFRVEQLVLQAPAARADGAGRPTLRTLADWAPLAADTWRNESERRLLIHERLADSSGVRPEKIKRWLYKEVLHADLDDPYLGLGDALFGDDVFGEEEV